MQRVFRDAFARHGAPARVLTDRGAIFKALSFEQFLADHDVDHTLTKPRHPWTNGRIERLFRTFKDTVFTFVWFFSSVDQIDRFCADFLTFYNRDRPHSRFGRRTPDEVFFGRPKQLFSRGSVRYFDSQFLWHKFG